LNTPEKIGNLYLRLNGFFTMPHFTTLGKEDYRHTDILAVRLSGSVERVGDEALEVDESFFKLLGKTKEEVIPLIAEVKGGGDQYDDGREKILAYLLPMFGKCGSDFVVVRFVRTLRSVDLGDLKEYPLGECVKFILKRLDSTQRITNQARGLTKFGSWAWSEDFLSDLLYMKNLGILNLEVNPQ
jgi:hypothetical protein